MNERTREALRKIRRWLCGPVMRCATIAAFLALVTAMALRPVAAGPALAQHGAKHVECPNPRLAQSSGQVQLHWTRHESDCVAALMPHGEHIARHDECVGFVGNASPRCEACHHDDTSDAPLTIEKQVQHTDCTGNDAGQSNAALTATSG